MDFVETMVMLIVSGLYCIESVAVFQSAALQRKSIPASIKSS